MKLEADEQINGNLNTVFSLRKEMSTPSSYYLFLFALGVIPIELLSAMSDVVE